MGIAARSIIGVEQRLIIVVLAVRRVSVLARSERAERQQWSVLTSRIVESGF